MHILSNGTTQEITPTKLESGLQFKVSSLSPFSVGWANSTPPTGGIGGSTGGSGDSSTDTYYYITATAGVGGSISTPERVKVRAGESAGFTITPNKGYQIADVKVNGKSIGAKKNYVFTNIQSDQTIQATFKIGGHGNPLTGVDADEK
ncbi:MAG: hypothetical protein RSE24_01950 [Oscillospiraceae bacterium]